MALASWTVFPQSLATIVIASAAAVLQLWRLIRWRGYATLKEPLVAILHMAFGFVPLGMAGIALS